MLNWPTKQQRKSKKAEMKVEKKVEKKVEMKVEAQTVLKAKTFTSVGTVATLRQDDQTTRITALEARVAALTSQLNRGAGSSAHYASDGTNLLNHMYHNALIYQDIFDAYNSNIIQKQGSAGGWDETSYSTNPWNGKRILKIGQGVQSNGNGLTVNIPQGYDVLWLRILGDRWTTFRVSPFNANTQANFQDWTEIYAGGFRNLNEIAPDGAGTDSYWNVHKWVAIPIRNGASQYNVYSAQNSDSWISGVAFGKNIWNHAYNSAVAFLWKLNPQTGDIGWVGENWNNDQLAQFVLNTNTEVSVPVVYTGNDKIVYIVEHNNNWQGNQHGNVFINGQQVERFRTTYLNPFSVHFNSKLYDRYLATRVPASLIQQGDKFIRLKIDMTSCNHHIHFREIGTHDYI